MFGRFADDGQLARRGGVIGAPDGEYSGRSRSTPSERPAVDDVLTLDALSTANFAAFADLLGSPGFGGCFCAVWTAFGPDWGARCRDAARPNLARTRDDLIAGRRPGFLVRRGPEVIAWTGAGPIGEFPGLASRLAARRSERTPDTWFLGCLAIAPTARGEGVGARIIARVMAEARAAGARRVEACPVDPWDEPRSYRGALSTYLRLGFREVLRESDGSSDVVLVAADLRGA